MNTKKMIPQIAIAAMVIGIGVAPAIANARDRDDYRYDRHNGNEWKGLSVISGVVGLAGLLSHDNTVAAVGLGASLYCATRANTARDCGPRFVETRRYVPDYRESRVRFDREWHRRDLNYRQGR
ncbi:MAG: hypothetical protein P4L46_12060 [Fimbriimonas sp.]|nr:hypothetical protein [Fimbriimonas sp.]